MSKLVLLTTVLAPACIADDSIETAISTSQMVAAADCPAGVPAALAPAADQTLAFVLDAEGVQKYACNAAGAWGFVAPEADLFRGEQVFIHHYAGPTWEWLDGSTVVGVRVAGATLDPSAIPWLLLRAASHNAIEGKMTFLQSGGKEFNYIPTTNDSQPWIEALMTIAMQNLGGWVSADWDKTAAEAELTASAQRAKALGASK